ncbi:N-acetylmuramoyl-L-alanine amidase [Aerococcus sp. HMSC23C02]|uniref:N-acetylmuramoyl-L-alanine amidase n=1 Tax=Aerococcus sp. HMSC23C02 TaxID=1581058 RepID=UPI0008A452ED|nr:N-acetylmuramoyl-L-alanine amidase [Aerococcus sp. HMSC23C02]
MNWKDHWEARRGHYFIYSLVVVLVLLGAFLTIFHLSQNQQKKTQADLINLRQGPGITYDIKEQVKKGTGYQVMREANDWLYVRLANGQTGWLPSWLMPQGQDDKDRGFIATVINDQVPILSKAKDGDKVGEAKQGDKFTILYQDKGWIQVQFQNETAWIDQSAIDITPGTIANEYIASLSEDEQAAVDNLLKDYPAKVVATAAGVNIREAPTNESDVIYKGKMNEGFAYLGQEDVYYKVKTKDGQEGYLANWLAKSDATEMAKKAQEAETTTSLSQKTIVLDPGHGGKDPGAISDDEKVYEKDVALASAQILKEKLEAAGAKVIMTREDDQFIELADRGRLYNEVNGALFLSLHYDSAAEATVSGNTIYYYDEASIPVAQELQSQLIEQMNVPNNGIEFGNFQVIRDSHPPALLLELGYMSNPNDVQKFSQKDYHERVAQAVYNGLVCYFQEDGNSQGQSVPTSSDQKQANENASAAP